MLDRRFGENDPTMTPEQRAAERYARQNERKMKKNFIFNLEDETEGEMTLTHGGRFLDLGENMKDDFDESESDALDDRGADFAGQGDRPRKRLRLEESDGLDQEDEIEELPTRRKTKNEIMKEVIAKSKMYKAERQAAKADDDDLRAELDKGMSEFYGVLRSQNPPSKRAVAEAAAHASPQIDPSRAAMLAGKSRSEAEKEYEASLRQLKLEARSKPTVRTKTDEEKAAEAAARLEEHQREMIRRMKGEPESSEDEGAAGTAPDEDVNGEDEVAVDDAEAFGLSAPVYTSAPRKELDVEDEDQFVLDDALVASDSEADVASDPGDESEFEKEPDEDGEDDFINGLVLPKESKAASKTAASAPSGNLAYTYTCPQTHQELLDMTKSAKVTDLPTIVQRIRALHHKSLAEGNQEKLDTFAGVLTQHVVYLADADGSVDVPFSVLESLLRHLHSMAKSSPEAVGAAFREHLQIIADERPLQLTAGDLIILTGVSTIFPTSDHFHSVVAPAMLNIGRYLGHSSTQSLRGLGVGAYCCSLALRYQRIAKRYIPEVVTYITNAFAELSPTPLLESNKHGRLLTVPMRMPSNSLRVKTTPARTPERLPFKALIMKNAEGTESIHGLALLHAFIRLTVKAAELWKETNAFPEMIQPCIHALTLLSTQRELLSSQISTLITSTLSTLDSLQTNAVKIRRPLLLHNHRPVAIKSSIPSFIENYNPDRHYDPDRQRANLSKLRAEHKKERKGAMRELRKDTNFMAREQLKEKKEKDVAYEKKYKRLVAEIQGEEGHEGKNYERERRKRKIGRF